MSAAEKIIPSGLAADYIADVIGRRFEVGSKAVTDKGRVVAPLGLTVPLEWRFSHGHSEHDYCVVCWKVSGDLYMAVGFETGSRTSTVILMDKARLAKALPGTKNMVSAADAARAKFATLEGYIEYFKGMIIGVWVKNGTSSTYTRVAL